MPLTPDQLQRLDRLLADPKVPKADKDAAVSFARQEQGIATTTTPTTSQDLMPRILRAAPAIAGAVRGGATGAELGAPLGPLGVLGGGAVGSALGAMGGETALGLGQRALGLPQGKAPLLPRVAQAGREGLKGGAISEIAGPAIQKGLKAAGNLGGRIASRLGATGRFGIGRGANEEAAAGMAGTRGAAGVVRRAAMRQGSEIGRAGQQILDELGDTEQAAKVTTRATRSMRNALRDLMTRGVRKGPEGYPDAGELVNALPSRMGKLGRGVAEAPGQTSERIEKIIEDTIHEANVAERLAAHPDAFDALMARSGRPVVDEMRRGWWTRTLFEATGTKGLQKGVLNPGQVVAAFDKLGSRAQQLFGDGLPAVAKFIDTLRGLPLGGAVPEKITPLPWSVILGGLGSLDPLRAGRAVAGATIGQAGPFLAAKLLTSPQGAAALTRALTSSVVSGAAAAAPTAARVGAQTVTQTEAQP